MSRKCAEIDAYIARAQPFARPILVKLRRLFHKASSKLDETLKWGHPSFEYKGIVGGMAAFKQHVAWGFWKAKLLKDPDDVMASRAASPMGAGNLRTVRDLPADASIIRLVKQAVALNEKGVMVQSRPKSRRPMPKAPADLTAALSRNSRAAETFAALSPSRQREYIEWLTEAKIRETRERRLLQAIEWMADGKPRNWKYERK